MANKKTSKAMVVYTTKPASGKSRSMRGKSRTNGVGSSNQVARNLVSGLDSQARAYAELLMNPCAKPLTHPLYAGSDAGILIRTECSFNLPNTTTTGTEFYVHWVPGAVCKADDGAGNVYTPNVVYAYGTGSAVAAGWGSIASNVSPGQKYLQANSAGARAVAACMQITYTGTELNRAGMVGMGRTAGDFIQYNQSYNTAAIEPCLEHFTRTPEKSLELTWMPGMNDQAFLDPNKDIYGTSAAQRAEDFADLSSGRQGITAIGYGFTPGTGLRVRLVCVYEYKPLVSVGVVNSSSSRATSINTLDHVLNKVQDTTNKMVELGVGAYKVFQVGKRFAGLLL